MYNQGIFIGIDVGKSGATVALGNGSPTLVTWKKNTPLEHVEFLEQQVAYAKLLEIPIFCVIEKVNAMPFTDPKTGQSRGMGATSAMSFGQNVGQHLGVLTALRIPYTEVRPQQWQKHLNGLKKIQGAMRKRLLKAHAERIFPLCKMTLDNCDAYLIADYARKNQAIL